MEKVKIRFGGYAWIGKALPTWSYDSIEVDGSGDSVAVTYSGTYDDVGETHKRDRFGGFLKVDHENIPLKVRAEFVTAKDVVQKGTSMADLADVETKSMAYFAHIGYELTPRVEVLARYDFFDPDTDMDYAAGLTGDDHEAWFTVGVNHYLDGLNAMFYLNYIHKMEPGKTAAGIDREVDNDLIVAQMQIVF